MPGPQGKAWPHILSTKTKRIEKARRLIEGHLKVRTIKGEPAAFQGMWSETFIVTLEDRRKAVLQFRVEPLDIAPFERARKMLGHYCPQIDLLDDEELRALEMEGKNTFYPVYSTYIEGTPWCDNPKQGKQPNFNISVMKSLGRVLALCISDEKHSEAVQVEIINKLAKRLKSANEKLDPFRGIIQDLLNQAQARKSTLEKLPLFQSHMDLNDMNIMVDDDGEVTGIIDWELSPPLQPFGMGLHRIHDQAGYFRAGVYYQREEYYEMERGLWDELMAALPHHHQETIRNNLEDVQLAFTIGVILNAFDFDTDGEYINNAILKALPKFLTYRIPMLRGDEPAYGEPLK